MKLGWFSPLPDEHTEIANHTMRLIPELCKKFELELYTNQQEASLKTETIPVNYSDSFNVWNKLNNHDFLIYNIGNNAPYHGDIWRASIKKPGIVVLHDGSLQHLFTGLFYESEEKQQEYLSYMYEFYGEEGKECGKKFFQGIMDMDYMSQKYPLTELALKGASGVIVHNKELYEEIKKINKYPVLLLDLPYPSKKVSMTYNKINNKVSIVIFGFLGPNRRIEQILDSIAEFSHKDRIELSIVGKLWDETYIKEKVKNLILSKCVKIKGFIKDEELDNILTGADLVFNLRYPTMGEASASQLRIWDHGVPSAVTNIGWYSSLPDNTVIKISLENEREEIKMHLLQLIENPLIFKKIGKNGKKHLEQEHSLTNYVNGMYSFLKLCGKWKANNLIKYYMIDRFASIANGNRILGSESGLKNLTRFVNKL